MNRLRGFGWKGLFQERGARVGKADDHQKKEGKLAQESMQPPRPAAWTKQQDQKVRQIKDELLTFGRDLEKRSTKMTGIDNKVNMPDDPSALPAKKLKDQRAKVEALATGMTVDLLNFCKDSLDIDLKGALTGIDFKAADWEQTLRTEFKTRMEQGGCPSDVAARTADWVFEQVLATGTVCMAAQEQTNNKVFGEYVKLAAGTVKQASEQLQSDGWIDQLLSPPKVEVNDKRLKIEAFMGKLEEIQQPKKKKGKKDDLKQEISSRSEISRHEVSTHKNKSALNPEDTSAIEPPENKPERKSEQDGDSSRSEVDESTSETASQ